MDAPPVRPMPMDANAPIGIFDSGIGGLSVLRHIYHSMPQEHLLYFADSGYAPYGDKDERQIIARSLSVASFLVSQGIKALVVACNTATAAAIQIIRQTWPSLIVVGVEPGLKPAAQQSKNKIIGVLATRHTLASTRFISLREHIAATYGVQFLSQACTGLADQIEKAELYTPATARLIECYVTPLIKQGADTLVLGCTHYPFVHDLISASAQCRDTVLIIDTGEAVTRQLTRQLADQGWQRDQQTHGSLAAYTTASANHLSSAFTNLLKLHPTVQEIKENPVPVQIS